MNLNYYCDVCGLPFAPEFLNPVTIEHAVYFCCTDCCRRILLVDNWRSLSRSGLLSVLGESGSHV